MKRRCERQVLFSVGQTLEMALTPHAQVFLYVCQEASSCLKYVLEFSRKPDTKFFIEMLQF